MKNEKRISLRSGRALFKEIVSELSCLLFLKLLAFFGPLFGFVLEQFVRQQLRAASSHSVKSKNHFALVVVRLIALVVGTSASASDLVTAPLYRR